jgi:O-antigen/teichoic acid export membrane protein
MTVPSTIILTLKQRVLKSGSWTLVGYGVNQTLRLGGNLILTRLLFPEAFGMIAIVQAVLHGAVMISDMGIGISIIQKDHGNDPVFLNTAWTVQIIRGILIWVGLCALAWPTAKFYGEPLLAGMLLVVGLNAVIGGFDSTKLHMAQRNLEVARVTQIEIGSYALGLLSTVFLAWLFKSVWALVWGSLITSFLKMFASHVALHGIRNQFSWDRDAVGHLRGFGRLILLGSGLTFLSVEGLRLLIGAMLDMRQLALFALASTMNLMFWQAILQLAWRVYLPAYSEVYRSNQKKLVATLFKARLTLIVPSWCLAVFFVFFGSQFMGMLYDERYHGSGAILELLAAGSLVGCIWGSYAGVLLAMGKAATSTILIAIQVVCQLVAIFVGYHYSGGIGIMMGIAVANWVMFPINAFVMYRIGLWHSKLDLILLVASFFIVALAWPRFTVIS